MSLSIYLRSIFTGETLPFDFVNCHLNLYNLFKPKLFFSIQNQGDLAAFENRNLKCGWVGNIFTPDGRLA